jgi:hypothetical protein
MGLVGIPDEESWFRTSYVPGGHATGWRRWGCLVLLLVGLVAAFVSAFGLR